jgi:hypothetical protein
MAILSPSQQVRLAGLPRPPMPTARLVDDKGRPTAAFTDYLNKLDAWQRALLAILGE